MIAAFFGQEFAWADIFTIGLLVLLEGALSIDNALVLGLLAKRLPRHQRSRALTYGLVGAFAFRFIAVFSATWLLEYPIVKLLGGGYLAYIAIKHLFFEAHQDDGEIVLTDQGEPGLVHEVTGQPLTHPEEVEEIKQRAPLPIPEGPQPGHAKFWPTVMVIELTDIAFAVDSILAAVGMVETPKDLPEGATHPKLWLILTGGLLGVVLMRFAAVIFIRLLERFPRFGTAAYMLVFVIGAKLILDWTFNTKDEHPLDFHNPRAWAFWAFWGLMLACLATGFLPQKHPEKHAEAPAS
jgi:YkoY family integral membrane protein